MEVLRRCFTSCFVTRKTKRNLLFHILLITHSYSDPVNPATGERDPAHQEVGFIIAVNGSEAPSLANTIVLSELPSVPGVGVEHVALQSPITWLVADLWR